MTYRLLLKTENKFSFYISTLISVDDLITCVMNDRFFLILWFLVAFVAVKVIHSHLNIAQVELLKSYSKMFSWVRFPDPVEIGWLLEVIVHLLYYKIYCCCCCSVTKLSLTLCHTMGYNRPGFPVLHYLQEFAQTHVHWIGDAIQPSHLMSSPSLAFNLFQH